ncbi:retrovirus-related pol polyprotein from transposon TNT 1-94 [Tanacetum coccineum]
MESVLITFDELTEQMAHVHSSSVPNHNLLTPGPISSGLVPNYVPAILYVPPTNKDLELLFQPMFDEYFETPTGDHQMPHVPAVPPLVIHHHYLSPLIMMHHQAVIHHHPWLINHLWYITLAIDSLWCFYNSVLSKVKQKNFKSTVTEDCWFQAMQDEIHEFDRLDVWELVPPPDCAMIIALKWIYKVKLDEYGDVLKNKARLVAKVLASIY